MISAVHVILALHSCGVLLMPFGFNNDVHASFCQSFGGFFSRTYLPRELCTQTNALERPRIESTFES